VKPTSNLIAVIIALTTILLTACDARPKYQEGAYLIPTDSSDSAKIVKVVGVSDKNYKVFTHFVSGGKLIQAQDYQNLLRTDVESKYIPVEPPHVDGAFSPDKYLSEHASNSGKSQ